MTPVDAGIRQSGERGGSAAPINGGCCGHGYVEPAAYTTGQGLPREQDLPARSGSVVLHTDSRNHAGSDRDPDNDVNLRLGYTEDVIGAVLALRSSGRPEIDSGQIGLRGRSERGGVVHNTLAAAPGLVATPRWCTRR